MIDSDFDQLMNDNYRVRVIRQRGSECESDDTE